MVKPKENNEEVFKNDKEENPIDNVDNQLIIDFDFINEKEVSKLKRNK